VKDQTCAELNEAFSMGTWHAPTVDDNVNNNDDNPRGRIMRPLHQFSEASFGSMQFGMLKVKKGRRAGKSY